LFHSGLEINGREYSYGSGGSGIFDDQPRQAPNARFRCSIELGSYDGGIDELNRAIDVLRHDLGFGDGDNYNLIRRNCNHFCNALSWQLLRKPIPGWVNRMAALGECCSCLLPKQLLEDSPVGGSGKQQQSASSSQLKPKTFDAFAGKGQSLSGRSGGGGGGGDGGSSSNGSGGERTGLFSRWSTSATGGTSSSSSSSSSSPDDLTDRREKARKAALARLESNNKKTPPP